MLSPFVKNPLEVGDKFDMVKQAKALGKKFDWSWSQRRLNETHSEWTKELMKAELDSMEDEVIEYPAYILPKGFELINSKKRLFEEGTVMHHCVYTNYWNKVKSKRYLVLRATDEEDNIATVGVHLHPKIYIDQIKSVGNKEPSKKIVEMVDKLLRTEVFKQSFEQNTAVYQEEDDNFYF